MAQPSSQKVPLPQNLYIIGTINVDETTSPISDKVLDRSNVIEVTSVDIDGFLGTLKNREPNLGDSINACRRCLTDSFSSMADHKLAFGYRAAEEFVRYHAFAISKNFAKSDEIIDELLVQKLFVKLRGGERQKPLIDGLAFVNLRIFPGQKPFWLDCGPNLDEFGSFQASR